MKISTPRRQDAKTQGKKNPLRFCAFAVLSRNIVAFCEDFGARNLFRFNVRRFERVMNFPGGSARRESKRNKFRALLVAAWPRHASALIPFAMEVAPERKLKR